MGRVVFSLPLTLDVRGALGISMPDDNQSVWVVGLRIDDDAIWARIKSGELGDGLSIGGKAMRAAA